VSIEDIITAAFATQLEPLRAELRAVRAELQALHRAVPPQLLTLQQAAKHLGLSLSTVRRRAKDGTLPVKRIGRSLRVDVSQMHAATEAEVAARVVSIRGTLATTKERLDGA
jgi:excisionase family DNA binding protein